MKTVAKDNGVDRLFHEQNLNILAFPMDSLMVFISTAFGMASTSSQLLSRAFLTSIQATQSQQCLSESFKLMDGHMDSV
jgi:hypothetical protein